jgi:hypothetical protein
MQMSRGRRRPAEMDRKVGLTTKATAPDADECIDRINVDARAVRYVRATFG